jgi:GNAT superfamily N-acetyltransferase
VTPNLSDAELAAACSKNFCAAFAALISHHSSNASAMRRGFGAVEAIATGLPMAFYNPVMVVEPGAAGHDVEAAVTWIRSMGLPASAQVRLDLVPDVGAALQAVDLICQEPATPGMAMHPIPQPPARDDELLIDEVTTASFDDWHTGIGYGPRFRNTYVASLVDDPVWRFVVGYRHGEPVSGAAAILSDGVVGIYAVGTVEHARRHGFGAAVTWAAIEAGVRAGAHVAVLQASPMAESVYRAMGFREVCRYAEYLPPDAGGGVTAQIPTVSLRPMTDAEYVTWRARILDDWVDSLVLSWGRDRSAAKAASINGINALLPSGPSTPNTWLFIVLDGEAVPVGDLWLAVREDQPDMLWVCYVFIDDAGRGRGYGRAAMLAAEEHARSRGFRQIGLSVYGFNHHAHRIYRNLGYQPIATQMRKPLH